MKRSHTSDLLEVLVNAALVATLTAIVASGLAHVASVDVSMLTTVLTAVLASAPVAALASALVDIETLVLSRSPSSATVSRSVTTIEILLLKHGAENE